MREDARARLVRLHRLGRQPLTAFILRDTTSDGAKKEVTDYHRVVTWDRLAEICQRYLSKGQGVYVEGMLLNRAYERDGMRRYVTEVRADEVNMLTWKKKAGVTKVTIDDPEPAAAA